MVSAVAAAAFLAASGLVASVNAGSVHAAHHQHAALHKKSSGSEWDAGKSADVTCQYTTYTTTWYGEEGLVPGTSTSTSSSSSSTSTWVAPTTTSTWVAPVTTSSSAPPPPPPTYSSAPESSSQGGWGLPLPSWSAPAAPSASSYASGSSGAGSISVNGDKWAMTYTPYTSSGGCKSASDVASDIAAIKSKGFTAVRLYATDCSGVQNIGSAAIANGLKMILGIYIDASGLGAGYDQVSELTSWGSSNGWEHVEMVVAGNEGIFNGFYSASDLAGFISNIKGQFTSAGFTGPITTTEPLGTIQENSATICGAVDVIAANIHPFFNADVQASGAGAFVSSQLSLLSDACGGSKEAYNLETGWPSAGDANGAAVPGTLEQQIAVQDIVSAAGSKSAVFSFENDGWKAPGALGVEQFWGCANLFPTA